LIDREADQVPLTLPESNSTGNVLCCRLRIRIESGGIPILFAVHDYVGIAGRILPSARLMMIAGHEEFAPDMLQREIVIPFDNLGPIGLGDYLSIPYRSDHACSLGDSK
jgi:hypothetical protein